MRRIVETTTGLVLLGISLQAHPAASQDLSLGKAADFVILGLSGDATVNGDVEINSSTAIIGDVGIGAFARSAPNQKVDLFVGTVFVHSTAEFTFKPETFDPTGGIFFGSGGDAIDLDLDQASSDALALSAELAGLAPTHVVGSLDDDDSVAVTSTGAVNVVSIDSLHFKSDVLELVSRPGTEDTFVINVGGNFSFSQSEVRLTGTTAGRVLFNFLDPNAIVVVKKSGSIFRGTLLVPSPSGEVLYHNPASFEGAIIAFNISLHSDFNIEHAPFVPPDTGGDTGTIGDRVWLDDDFDGVQDAEEVGLNGVVVDLFDSGMSLVASATTGGDGNYLFTDLPADTYTVVVDAATLPVSLEPTFDFDDICTPDQADVPLAAGAVNLEVDFGYAEGIDVQ